MAKKTLLYSLLLLLSLCLQACGGDKGSTVLKTLAEPTPGYSLFWGSCVAASEVKHDCREWYGDFFSTINMTQACTSIEGNYLEETYCKQEALLGICSLPLSIESETRIYYYESDWSVSKASKDCLEQGSGAQWLPLAN